jgi:flagellar motor switch protein FliN/FliY
MAPLGKGLPDNIDSFDDISVTVEGRFEERLMDIRDVLAMRPDAVVQLSRPAGETLGVYIGNVLLASAEVIVIDENLALRITELARFES